MLRVREVFRTLQGEGSRAGSPAVFVRLSGCNLWSGRGQDREVGRGECARWCDTDFFQGSAMDLPTLIAAVAACADGMRHPLIVITGGEPMLQLPKHVEELQALAQIGEVAIETNGTIAVPRELLDHISHITVSPKPLVGMGGSMDHLQQRTGTDLKVVVPTPFALPELAMLADGFSNAFVQPMDTGDSGAGNLATAIATAEALGWRVSVQTHKLMGLP